MVKCQSSGWIFPLALAVFIAYMYLSSSSASQSTTSLRHLRHSSDQDLDEGRVVGGSSPPASRSPCVAATTQVGQADTQPPIDVDDDDDIVILRWRYFLNETMAMVVNKECQVGSDAPCVVDQSLMEPSVNSATSTAALNERWARVIQHRRRTNNLLRSEVDAATIHNGISHREPRDTSLEDDYTWMLPQHTKLFCPSYMGMRYLFQFHTRYSPKAVLGDVALSLKECPAPVALHILDPTAINIDEFFVWKIFSSSIDASSDKMTTNATLRSLEPSFVSFCVYECLRSPYCARVLADRVTREGAAGSSSGERQECRLLQHRHTGRALPADPRQKPKLESSSLLLHIPARPEAGPSLVQSHLRWDVVRGPLHVVRMDAYAHRCTQCVWEYKLSGRHGVDYDEIGGLAFVDVFDIDHNHGKSPLMADAGYSGLPLFSLPQLVAKGKFTLYMNSQPTSLYAGHRINVTVRFPLVVPSGGGDRCTAIEVRHHFVIKLLWDAHEIVLVTDDAPRLTPSGTFQTQVKHSRNRECAPLLRPNECVVSNVAIRFAAPRLQVSISDLYLATTWRNGDPITLLITDQARRRDTNGTCFSVVDGHTALLRAGEVTPFKCLVIRNDCVGVPFSSFTSGDTGDAAPTVKIEGPKLGNDQLSMIIPLQQLLGCGEEAKDDDGGKMQAEGEQKGELDLPILLSSSQYRCPQCALEQLENFFAFAPRSIVVMRVDNGIGEDDFARIRNRSREFHPRVYFHRDSYGGTLITHPAHNHALNIRFMAEHHPTVQYSHVVFIAANELLVRAGIENYVAKYDLSSLNADVAPGFMTDKCNIFNFFGCIYCDDAEGLRTGHSMSAWSLDEFGVRNEFHIAAVMRKYKLTKFPIRQVYLEGSFFRKEIGLVMTKILLDEFDATGMTNSTHNHFTGEELPEEERRYNRGPYAYVRWYATCEIIPMIFFHALCDDDLAGNAEPNFRYDPKLLGLESRPGGRGKCGEHSGTMLWRNPNWEVQKDDVKMLRCSPLPGPFSFKRFPIDAGHPLRKEVLDLQRDSKRSRLLRESYDNCKDLSPHRPR